MSAPDVNRQADHLSGEIGQGLYDDFWAKLSFRYDQHEYELLDGEEAAEVLGYGDDDPYLTVLRRKADGQLFEVEFEVTVFAREAVPEHEEIPGQLALIGGGA